MWCVHVNMLLSVCTFSLLSFPFPSNLLSFNFLSFPVLSFPLLSHPLLPSFPLSSLLLSFPLCPGWCTSHQTLKETKAPSLSWSWEELSVPSALFDDSISNDTLILTPHCLFFLYDEIQLERRATGHIIKMWLKREEPRASLETTHDNFLTHQRKEHDRVSDKGIVGTKWNHVFSLQIMLSRGDTKAGSKQGSFWKDLTRIN